MKAGEELRPRAIGELLDDAIFIVRRDWRSLLTLSAIVILPVAMAYAILQSFQLRAFIQLIGEIGRLGSSGAEATPDPTTGIVSSFTSSVGLLYMLARVYLASALYASAGRLVQGRAPGPRQMLAAGWRGFIPLLVVDFLVSVAVNLSLLLSIPLLGVGGFVVAVLLSMAGPAVVIEGGITQAFARSVRLVRRHFWRVALITIGGYLIAAQLESAFAFPVLIREAVFGAQGMSALNSNLAWGWKVFDGSIQGAAIAIVTPFLQLTTLLCYLDLRAREEGMDLVVRARALLSAA